jgi:hypothetical protein
MRSQRARNPNFKIPLGEVRRIFMRRLLALALILDRDNQTAACLDAIQRRICVSRGGEKRQAEDGESETMAHGQDL